MSQEHTFAVEDRDVVGGQLRLRLDANEQRRTSTSGHDLPREMAALEDKSKGSFLRIENKTHYRSRVFMCMNAAKGRLRF